MGIKRLIILLSLISILTLTGCKNWFSDDMAEVFTSEESLNTFYGKGTQRQYVNDKLIEDISFTEWRGKNNRYRIDADVVSKDLSDDHKNTSEKIRYIYNDNQLILYYPEQDKYIVRDVSLQEATDNVFTQGINTQLTEGSIKKSTIFGIMQLSSKYDLRIEDDVKLGSKHTQHVIATGKLKSNRNETKEYWIDQQNWMVVKTVQKFENYRLEFEYQDYKINPLIFSGTFKVSMNDQSQVKYAGKNMETVNEKISLSKAPKRLGVPVFYLQPDKNIALKSSRYVEGICDNAGNIELTYNIGENKEIIVMSRPFNNSYDQIDYGGDQIEINGLEAVYIEGEIAKEIKITRGQTVCEMYIKNGSITKEELIQLAKGLKIIE